MPNWSRPVPIRYFLHPLRVRSHQRTLSAVNFFTRPRLHTNSFIFHLSSPLCPLGSLPPPGIQCLTTPWSGRQTVPDLPPSAAYDLDTSKALRGVPWRRYSHPLNSVEFPQDAHNVLHNTKGDSTRTELPQTVVDRARPFTRSRHRLRNKLSHTHVMGHHVWMT